MKHPWWVYRSTLQRPDARQRWDQAYQSILRWSLANEPTSSPSANGKEECHASGGICPSLDPRSGQTSDH